MKIFSIVIMAAVMVFMPVDASAQKLGNLLKKAASSDVVNSVINTYVPGPMPSVSQVHGDTLAQPYR